MPHPKGHIPWNKGLKLPPLTEECKRKLSKAHKGKKLSEECKQKLSELAKGRVPWNKGKTGHCSPETIIKMRLSHTGVRNYRWKGGKKGLQKRRMSNPQYVLGKRMKDSINNTLRRGVKNGRSWCDLVGYDRDMLVKHLKSTMPNGYTWKDFLDGKLHIDHKIPKSVFNYTQPEHIDFKRCWALSNLQLLPAYENLSKSNKLTTAFQPSLQLGLD